MIILEIILLKIKYKLLTSKFCLYISLLRNVILNLMKDKTNVLKTKKKHNFLIILKFDNHILIHLRYW